MLIFDRHWPAASAGFFKAYLLGWLFFLGISLGGMAAVMVHHLTGGAWGYFVRRFGEAAAGVMPLLFLLFIPILFGLHRLYPWADYFAVNVSSPNTPGLRALQERDRLDALLAALQARLRERAEMESGRIKPLLVKVAPDLDEAALDELVEVCLARGASGLIAVNTTISRDGLSAAVPATLRDEAGGLSGRPLHTRAVAVVGLLAKRAEGRLPIIGCGGVFTVDDAQRLLDAGASLLQLYTSFIYEGPGIARYLAHGLALREPPAG